VQRAAHERRIEEARKKQAALEARHELAKRERERAEQVRLELLKTAEMERMRAEVQKDLELEQARRSHEHQRQLAALRQDVRLRRYTIVLSTSLLLSAALLLGGLSAYFGKLRPDRERLVAGYQALIDAQRNQSGEARRRLQELERERLRLQAELEAAKERERNSARSNAIPAPELRKSPASLTRSTPPRRHGAGPRFDPHDPLNPEL
jgi:hypothetical protein